MQHHLTQIFSPKVVSMTQGKRAGLSATLEERHMVPLEGGTLVA